jgi:hypothetical protein
MLNRSFIYMYVLVNVVASCRAGALEPESVRTNAPSDTGSRALRERIAATYVPVAPFANNGRFPPDTLTWLSNSLANISIGLRVDTNLNEVTKVDRVAPVGYEVLWEPSILNWRQKDWDTKGVVRGVRLRDYLDHVCCVYGATWRADSNSIVLNYVGRDASGCDAAGREGQPANDKSSVSRPGQPPK